MKIFTHSTMLKKYIMQKGEIVLVKFPFTDLSGTKVRPALLLKMIDEDVLLMFITTNLLSNNGFDILVQPSIQNGLKKTSLLKVCKLITLHNTLVYGRLGFLTKSIHQKGINNLHKFLLID